MSSDNKHDQRLGEAERPSEASEATPGTTTAAASVTDQAPTEAAALQPPDALTGDARAAEPWRSSAAADSITKDAEAPAADEPAPSPARAASAPTGTTTTPVSRPPKQGGSGSLWWALALIVLLAGGGAALWFGYLQQHLPTMMAGTEPAVAPEVDTALTDLDARVARLRQQIDGMAPRLDALERSLAALSQSVEQMDGAGSTAAATNAASAAAASAESLKQLNDRMAVLESQAAAASGLAQQVRSLEAWTTIARDTASKVAANVLAVGQLVQAVNTGGAFVRPLASVRGLGGDDPETAQAVAELEPLASRGVPTLAVLRGAFPAAADAIVRAAPAGDGSGNWTDRVVEQLASLVAIRRTGPDAIAGGGIDGVLETTQQALNEGNLTAAVTALQSLDGAPAQAAKPWLDLADQRLTAERALANMQQRAIARLSAAKG